MRLGAIYLYHTLVFTIFKGYTEAVIDALIFDNDGVLVMSERPRFSILQAAAWHHGVDIPDEAFLQIVGKTTLAFFRDALPEVDEATKQDIIDDYSAEFKEKITEHIQPVTTTVDFISEYKGAKPLALASMSGRRELETVMNFLGILDKFKVVMSKDDVTHHKPDPEVYPKAAKKLGLEPSKCAVIEDTRVGAQADIASLLA